MDIPLDQLGNPDVRRVALNDFEQYLNAAASRVAHPYIRLPIIGDDPIFRERIYCYELYHQLRLAMEADQQSQFILNGELDKGGHPILKGFRQKPDLLYHIPGRMDGNLVIVEVKAYPLAGLAGFEKDLKTLTRFINEAQYSRGVLLVYGGDWHGSEAVIDGLVHQAQQWAALPNSRIDLRMLELLWHREVGQAPQQYQFI